MPTAANYTDVLQRFYLAYFGRPADPQGLINNANQLLAAGAPTTIAGLLTSTNPTVLALINGFSSSAESTALLSGSTTTARVSQLYQNLLNRAGDVAGVTYWSTEIDSGRLSLARAALAIADAGAAATGDSAVIAAKVTVATNYTTAIDTVSELLAYSGTAAASSARTLLSTVTVANAGTPALITTFQANIDNNISTLVSGGGGAAAGTTTTLASTVDTVTGTSGNDTFIGTANTAGTGTFTAADTINGSSGTDILTVTATGATAFALPAATVTAVETINVRAVLDTAAEVTTVAATNFVGATAINLDRSTSAVTVTGLATGAALGIIGDSTAVTGASKFAYATATAAVTLNVSGGTTGGTITNTANGATAVTINSTGAANTVGATVLSNTASVTGLTINAATNYTSGNLTGFGGTSAAITVAGAATAVSLGTIEAATVKTINASGLTAGGVTATLNNNVDFVFTGGAGNDLITTGVALTGTTASVNAGAGTADRLTLADNAHINSLALGNKYSGFEVVSVGTGGGTLDLSLLATNNTINALRVTGSSTVTGINAATAAAVTVTASNTSTLAITGALNPGQIDTLNLAVNDGSSTVNTLTITAPTIAGVEILSIAATDNATITSLANALALTNVNVSGAAATSITSTAIALQTNFNVNAGTATGNLTLDLTGATTNGFSVTGGSGVNIITGGSQVFSANLSASAAKADQVILTNATGGTLALPNATVTGFTSAATTGDLLNVIGTAAIQANVAAGTTTGITNLLGGVTSGILTFTGTAAATATLADRINAAASANFAGAANEVIAFEFSGSTYVVSQQATADAFDAGTDLVVQLTGVTGVTSLSITASGANQLFVQ